jgi:hypothetical protein
MGVTYGNSLFVAVSYSGTLTRAMTSGAYLLSPAFTLTSSLESRTVSTIATGFTINSTGGAIASFTINSTPPGMSFNSTTGALTGTPSTVAPETTYTITATNTSGTATQTFALTVTAAPVSVDNSAAQATAQAAANAEAARVAAANAYAYEAAAAAEANRVLMIKLLHATVNTAASYSELALVLLKILDSAKCVKGKTTKYVKSGTKCPTGYVKSR